MDMAILRYTRWEILKMGRPGRTQLGAGELLIYYLSSVVSSAREQRIEGEHLARYGHGSLNGGVF